MGGKNDLSRYKLDSEEGREKLAEGHHEFPFSFQLPSGGVSTSFEGKYGSIRYWLKSEMEKPWSFNHKTKKAFTLISPIDINRMEYLMMVEKTTEKTLCCWCCTSGPISLYARIDRKGYCPGESIAITADFENLSSRTIVPHATLHQTQTFVAGGKSRFRRSKFTIVTGLAIQPSRMANWDSQLLKIPAVSPSIVNSCLIRVDYAVRITLQIPGVYNLSVDLPVVIGTVPLRTQPPNYRTLQSNMENLPRSNETRLTFYPPAPPYNEVDMSSLPDESPPMYAECVEGSVDITEDDDNIIGDTRFTPMYACVHDYPYQPPPAYSEIDPHPAPVVEEGQR
ncbi:arrestin domain-containing protein 3-like isoform X2 [Tachypleus tridentatus]|uniref:arrestin domain-containing protein 3-like isoform X2 n=1 Tax=Tachypleus tridentatus TaxID=6853 RepID=UPI003FD56B84